MEFDRDQLLTSSEVGLLLQVNPSSVKKWVDDGLLAAFRTPGGHRRIRACDLVTFLQTHRMPIPTDLKQTARKRMLIVDDDVAQLKALVRAFERFDAEVEVVTSTNGVDALVLVGSFQPHIVLLDIFMPAIDGLEVCRRLKTNPKTSGINVIVVSGRLDAPLKRKAFEAGAVRCLLKPITASQVMDLVAQAAVAGGVEARAD